MMKKLNSKKKKGFTLIELIIVVAILGILAAIAIPKYGSAQRDAKINTDIANAKNIANAATMAITKGEITLTTAITATTLATSETTGGQKIVAELQSVPTPKATGTAFTVDISTDGNVTVKNGSLIVYPRPATGKATNMYAEAN